MENKKLTDNELESVVEVAKEIRYGAPNDILIVKDKVKVNPNAELESVTVETAIGTSVDASTIDLIAKDVELMPSVDIDLFDVNNEEVYNKAIEARLTDTVKSNMDLTEDEVYQLLSVIDGMKNKSYRIYENLPDKVKNIIDNLMRESNIPFTNRESVSRFVMTEMINDAGVEEAYIDFEKALDQALNIPSIADMYSEHTRSVMEENIPAMIEKIKDVEPEKAELLMRVKEAFTNSYTYEVAKKAYEENSSIRKAVRRNSIEVARSLDLFNHKNDKSNFKMNDVTEILGVLKKILITDPNEIKNQYESNGETIPEKIKAILDFNITEDDIDKFAIFITKPCMNMDPTDIVDAAYMYYMMKNIIMLKYTHEAKTEFAAELINNICDMIVFIRNKEAEFYAANLHKPESTKKLQSNKKRKH